MSKIWYLPPLKFNEHDCSKMFYAQHTHSEVSVLFYSHFWVPLAKPSGSNSASRTDTVFSARPTVKCFMDVSMPSVLWGHWQIKVGPIPLVLDFGEISPVMMNIWWDSDEISNIWNFRRAKCPWTPSRTDVVAVGQNLRFSAGWCSTERFKRIAFVGLVPLDSAFIPVPSNM